MRVPGPGAARSIACVSTILDETAMDEARASNSPISETRPPKPTPRRVVLYSDSDVEGGAERSMFNLVDSYEGSCQLIVSSPSPRLVEAATRHSTRAEVAPIESRSPLVLSFIDHRRAFAAMNIDILQVTLYNPFAARVAMLAGMSLRIPTIAVEQLVLPSKRRRGRWLKRIISMPLTGHVAVGAASARDLERYFGVAVDSIDVVHNGVPDVPVEPHVFARGPVVGCAARLEDQKSLGTLVAAMVDIPEARLVLVGDGDRRGELEAQSRDLGIADRVDFVGWQENARPFIAGFDLFVLPSRDESFPLTIVEAMLAATPVIATDVGSVAEAVIDGETGLLVPPGDGAAQPGRSVDCSMTISSAANLP